LLLSFPSGAVVTDWSGARAGDLQVSFRAISRSRIEKKISRNESIWQQNQLTQDQEDRVV
jgi:hypothetical protein